ncbi:putative methyltransferase NSUN7 isoform X2 [Ictalurus punctatus]|uniref:Methyltransferase NSUN7 isoform X2 n=1 Tax=Ictalurus punctatus TaxID=7998 RepID=A0A9F7R1M6_ICTPU|nr:putative methyltransferase NSUN7 isoform X2 [Ictalurus punctatus]
MTKPGFPDRVYERAADAFRASCVEKTLVYRYASYAPVPHPAAGDTGNENHAKQNELWAYELAFNTLKFQALLEDVLIDSCFQATRRMPDDLMALAMVMLYDLQDRKFQPREPMTGEGEGLVEEVRLVEDSLFRFRTKLAASLARFRIKQDLVCIDDILPKSVKEKHQRKHKLPTCAWVNTLKSRYTHTHTRLYCPTNMCHVHVPHVYAHFVLRSVDEVCVTLKTQGFVQVDPHTHLEGRVFCKDTHCPDVLLFPRQAPELRDKTTLLLDRTLIIQEKSRSLAVCALRPLLAKNTDILLAGSFSAHTVAHVGVQASVFSNHVYVCGLPADSALREELHVTLSRIGCKNVRLLPERLAELSEGDSRLQKVRVVLVLPRCTASALSDPIAHIVNEDGDRKLLQDLSQGAVSDANLEPLIHNQIHDLSHALTFPKVHGVVYCTCSVYAEENELVVKSALKNAAARTKLRPFRIVSTGWTDEETFLRLQASDTGEGCFLCVLKREEAETVQNILARAAAKGLLNGLALHEKLKKTRTKDKQGGAPTTPPLPPQPDPSLTSAPSVSEQLPVDPPLPEAALEHARRPAHPNHASAAGPVENRASEAARRYKKIRRRKSRASRRGAKTKKPRTRSSRKKAPRPRVRPAEDVAP